MHDGEALAGAVQLSAHEHVRTHHLVGRGRLFWGEGGAQGTSGKLHYGVGSSGAAKHRIVKF